VLQGMREPQSLQRVYYSGLMAIREAMRMWQLAGGSWLVAVGK
jgi:hypothetical protein